MGHYLVQQFFEQYGRDLGLEILAGQKGLHRRIHKPEVQRPGLSLAGFVKSVATSRILLFGRHELDYMRELDSYTRSERLRGVLNANTPAVVMARNLRPPRELTQLCESEGIPLFRSKTPAAELFNRIAFLLTDVFAPMLTLHGTLVEIFGVGVLIQGDSSVGKSEAALGLIEKGHRLISDDSVRIKRQETYLVGSGPELTRHLMEIRGIGLINVAHLYGAICVRNEKSLDLVVRMETWDDRHFYDRVGLDEKFIDILGINVPYHLLPVKPGRDVVLLLETIALNFRLKEMGYHSAKEFNMKLLDTIVRRKRGQEASVEVEA